MTPTTTSPARYTYTTCPTAFCGSPNRRCAILSPSTTTLARSRSSSGVKKRPRSGWTFRTPVYSGQVATIWDWILMLPKRTGMVRSTTGTALTTPGRARITAWASSNWKVLAPPAVRAAPPRLKRTCPAMTANRLGPSFSTSISAWRTMALETWRTPVKARAPRNTPSMASTVRSLWVESASRAIFRLRSMEEVYPFRRPGAIGAGSLNAKARP